MVRSEGLLSFRRCHHDHGEMGVSGLGFSYSLKKKKGGGVTTFLGEVTRAHLNLNMTNLFRLLKFFL